MSYCVVVRSTLLLVFEAFLARFAHPGDGSRELFERKVAPILEMNCSVCHGGTTQRSGLDLRTPESILRGGQRGPAVVSGKPEASLLYRLVTHSEEPNMPMGGARLADSEIERIAEWIRSLPVEAATVLRSDDSHGRIRMRSAISCGVLVAGLSWSGAFADQVTLKNGDRLTGRVTKSDGKTLEMKADYAGSVVIPWDAVTALSSDRPLYLTSKDGQLLVGTVSLAEGRVEIQSAEAGRVALAKDLVAGIRSQEEQAVYKAELDRLQNPRLRDLWSGFVETGLSMAQGNAKTTNFNLGMNATRTTRRDKIGVHFTSLYAKSSTTGPSLVTANAMRGGLSYDLNLSARSFAFGFTELEFDEFQKLDLRFVTGGGMGWHAVRRERTTLDLSGGGSLNKEFFSTGLRRTSGEVLFGQELSHKLGASSQLKQKLVFYPNLTESGEYRVTFDSSMVTSLRKWLGWHLTLSNRYLSNPLPGTKKNDVLFTTGIRLTFAP